MEGNINYIFTKNLKEHYHREKSIKCMIKRISLTSLCTRLDILSLSLQLHHFFPFNLKVIMKGLIISCCLSTARLILSCCQNVISPMMLCQRPYKISHYFSISKFTLSSKCYLIIIVSLDASYFNVISLFNKCDFTNKHIY